MKHCQRKSLAGLTLVEVILAFLLLLLFVAGLIQTVGIQTSSQLYASVKMHLVNENRVLGYFLASYTEKYNSLDTSPIETGPEPSPITFPAGPNPLGWAALRFADARATMSSNEQAPTAMTIMQVEYDASGLWRRPTGVSTDLSNLSWKLLGMTEPIDATTGLVKALNWTSLSSGCGTECDPAAPVGNCCIALVNMVKRENYAVATVSPWEANVGGMASGATFQRETPIGTRTAKGGNMIYTIRVFKEKVESTPLPSIRLRVWMRFSPADTAKENPAARVFEGMTPILVETVYQKRS